MRETCDGCGYGWADCKCDNEVEHKPNLSLDRLKAVSKELAVIISYYDHPKNERRAPISMEETNWRTIAADILRLAEDVEKAYHEGYDQGVTGQPRRKRLTPAARKDDDEKC